MAESVFDRDLNLSNFRIKNLGTAIDPNDAVSKKDLELQNSKMFNNIESFSVQSGTLYVDVSNPTDIYSCLVFQNGLLMYPSSTDSSGDSTERDYQIVTFATYSRIEFTNPFSSSANILVLYNTVSNQ